VGVCVHIRSGADGEDGNGNGNGNGNVDGDGVGDGDHCTRNTYTSMLATSTSGSKLPQTLSHVLAKASTDLEPSISQSFHKLRVCHQPKASRCGETVELEGREPSINTPPRLSRHSNRNS
jgi:hypothetical protein